MRIGDALRLAQEADLDLVEVAPEARPPVCKLMDYGKFKYESAQKARESRRNQRSDGHQGDEAPAEDRHPRLRDQEGPRRALPQGRRQGQGHDHVPRPGAVPAGARLPAAAAACRRTSPSWASSRARPKQDGRNMIMVLAPHKKPAQTRRRSADADGRRARSSTGPAAAAERQPRRGSTCTRTAPTRRTPAPSATRVERRAMPKNKTHSGTKKRIKVTGSGKLHRQQAGKRHNLENKSSSRTRRLDGRSRRRRHRGQQLARPQAVAPTGMLGRSDTADPDGRGSAAAAPTETTGLSRGTREAGGQRPEEAPRRPSSSPAATAASARGCTARPRSRCSTR